MEIIVRAAVIFLFLWMITRLVGRSTVGELSTFQLIIFVTMGDLVQNAVTQQDSSITGGLLAVSVFALLTVGISWVNVRVRTLRGVTHGVPVVIVQKGTVLEEVLRRERLSINEVMAAARDKGIRDFAEIDLAVLETDGDISFFTTARDGHGAPERPGAG